MRMIGARLAVVYRRIEPKGTAEEALSRRARKAEPTAQRMTANCLD